MFEMWVAFLWIMVAPGQIGVQVGEFETQQECQLAVKNARSVADVIAITEDCLYVKGKSTEPLRPKSSTVVAP